MSTPQQHTPVPRIQPRKGFAWLPLEQQLSVVALVALLVLALLPACIDSGRAGSGQLKAALFKPRSVAAALTRLERHYGLHWWTTGSAGEQRLRQQLVLAACGICAVGALAASKAQQPATPATVGTTTPRTYGTAAPIRTRSAVAFLEDDHV
jgi:hypothetical protein